MLGLLTKRAMRLLEEKWISHWRREERKLTPSYGHIAIGNADFEWTLKVCVGESYLSALRKGLSPEEALFVAKTEGYRCVQKWNDKTSKSRVSFGEAYTLQVWEESGDDVANMIHRMFLLYRDTTS